MTASSLARLMIHTREVRRSVILLRITTGRADPDESLEARDGCLWRGTNGSPAVAILPDLPQLFEDFAGGVLSGPPGYPASRVRARTTKKEPAYRRAVPEPIRAPASS